MADSTRDPLSMDTVGSRGRWVAPAQPGRGSSSFLRPSLWRATLSPLLSQRRQLSPGFQEATTLAGPHAINSALSPPSLLSQAASLCPPSPLPAHHLQWRPHAHRCRSHHEAEDQTEWPAEDTRVKGPALHTDMATPRAGQNSGDLEACPALSLYTSHLCGPRFPYL